MGFYTELKDLFAKHCINSEEFAEKHVSNFPYGAYIEGNNILEVNCVKVDKNFHYFKISSNLETEILKLMDKYRKFYPEEENIFNYLYNSDPKVALMIQWGYESSNNYKRPFIFVDKGFNLDIVESKMLKVLDSNVINLNDRLIEYSKDFDLGFDIKALNCEVEDNSTLDELVSFIIDDRLKKDMEVIIGEFLLYEFESKLNLYSLNHMFNKISFKSIEELKEIANNEEDGVYNLVTSIAYYTEPDDFDPNSWYIEEVN